MPSQKKNKIQEQNLDAIILQGITSPFWLAIKHILQQEIDTLEDAVLNDDSLSEQITVSKRDYARKWLQYNKHLLRIPEEIAEKGSVPSYNFEVNFDPYKAKIGVQDNG